LKFKDQFTTTKQKRLKNDITFGNPDSRNLSVYLINDIPLKLNFPTEPKISSMKVEMEIHEAIEYYQKSLDIKEKSKDPMGWLLLL
jgi:hypothetical protein